MVNTTSNKSISIMTQLAPTCASSLSSAGGNEEVVDRSNHPEEIYFARKELELSASRESQKKVSNYCAICLCQYEVGDTIVCSNSYVNARIDEESPRFCKHAFHDHCILEYLQRQKETPCPCCRRDFTDLSPNCYP